MFQDSPFQDNHRCQQNRYILQLQPQRLHFLRLKREYELTGNTEKLKESEEWLEKELYIMRYF